MWSVLSSNNDKISAIDLHSTFLYQLAAQINYRYDNYFSKRLNPNYGLFTLSNLNPIYSTLASLAALCIIVSFSSDYLVLIFSSLENYPLYIKCFSLILGITLAFIVGLKSEIVFSTNKSKGQRKIDDNEIMTLYRSIILKNTCLITRKYYKKHKQKYIIIIEDLDRTQNSIAILDFLKELRKYYILEDSSNNNTIYKHDVIFIVNIKPESIIINNKEESDIKNNQESIFAKLFDYTVNLQTINVDNYDSILKGLLLEKKEEI